MAWVLHHDERQTNLVERARWPRRDVVRLAVRQRRSLCRFFPIFHPGYVSRWPRPRSYGGCSVRIVKFLSQEGVLTIIFADSHTGQVPDQALRSVSRPRWAYLRSIRLQQGNQGPYQTLTAENRISPTAHGMVKGPKMSLPSSRHPTTAFFEAHPFHRVVALFLVATASACLDLARQQLGHKAASSVRCLCFLQSFADSREWFL